MMKIFIKKVFQSAYAEIIRRIICGGYRLVKRFFLETVQRMACEWLARLCVARMRLFEVFLAGILEKTAEKAQTRCRKVSQAG